MWESEIPGFCTGIFYCLRSKTENLSINYRQFAPVTEGTDSPFYGGRSACYKPRKSEYVYYPKEG